MPFSLLSWAQWLIAAIVGGMLALFVSTFAKEKRFARPLAFVIAVLSALCAVIGAVKWFRS